MANTTRRLVAIPALGLATTIALTPAALAQEPPTPQTNVAPQSNTATITQVNQATQVNFHLDLSGMTPTAPARSGGGGH